tara:strand:- start:12565 stop:13701 length:1137 start_codon:yes stop_codon:yes gene_type:complete
MEQETTLKISRAIGVRSVFLAARLDPKLVNRFFHMQGEFLLDQYGNQVTKRTLADVMVYMAGQYSQSVTLEDVQLGLLASSKEYGEMSGQDVTKVEEPKSSEEPVRFIDEEPDDDEAVEMESTVNDESDWVTDDYSEDIPTIHPSKGKPGVKPDDDMIERMTTGEYRLTRDDVHISTLDLAIRFYDFIGNDLARPETDKDVQHKVKLALGSTMKALGWKKRMRKGEWGWHPNDESFFDGDAPVIDPDAVVLRKRDTLIENDIEETQVDVTTDDIANGLPKLSEKDDQASSEDDLPWDDFTDGSPDKKVESVCFINMIEGREETEKRELVFGQTYTFFMDDDGIERMVEWDQNKSSWVFYIEDSDQNEKVFTERWERAE